LRKAIAMSTPTAQRLAISLLDHFDHSASSSNVCTARRLSALLRLKPCLLFAESEYRIASRSVPGVMSSWIVVSPASFAPANR
jgi:hypothetical protein